MPSRWNPFTLWSIAALVVFAIHCLTLQIDPLIMQDEVQVLDYGRTVLQPGTDWAMSWDVDRASPVLQPPYVAVALQELAYRMSAPSHLGPRILSVIAALLAAACALGWLLARGVPRLAALALSLSFLLDPIFALTYRGGRVDAWAFAACLAACWLLRSGAGPGHGPNGRARLLAAGALAALAPFLWPAAVALWPLILVEFLNGASRRSPAGDPEQPVAFVGPFLCLSLGGVICLLVLSAPLLYHLEAYWAGFQTMLAVQDRAAVIQQPLYHVLGVHDPIIFLIAIIALVVRREIGLLIALAVAVAMMYRTMLYPPRVMYLLPYFLAIVGGASQALAARRSSHAARALHRWMLILLLAWSIGTVLVYRPVAAVLQRPANDPESFATALQAAIPPGPRRVLMEEWAGYYAGRESGWLMFNPGSPVSAERYRAFLETMDYIVVRQEPLHAMTTELAEQLGFERHVILEPQRGQPRIVSFAGARVVIPPRHYPAVVVYRHPTRQPSAG